jgi:hypothetical protein
MGHAASAFGEVTTTLGTTKVSVARVGGALDGLVGGALVIEPHVMRAMCAYTRYEARLSALPVCRS